MAIDSEKNRKVYALMVIRAWLDAAFEQQFRNAPKQTALDNGMSLPQDVEVSVTAQGAAMTVDTSGPHPRLLLPLPPRPADLADEELSEWEGHVTNEAHMFDYFPGGNCSSSSQPPNKP
jgi:hypothetical protein